VEYEYEEEEPAPAMQTMSFVVKTTDDWDLKTNTRY
jgi:hypothetical protein